MTRIRAVALTVMGSDPPVARPGPDPGPLAGRVRSRVKPGTRRAEQNVSPGGTPGSARPAPQGGRFCTALQKNTGLFSFDGRKKSTPPSGRALPFFS